MRRKYEFKSGLLSARGAIFLLRRLLTSTQSTMGVFASTIAFRNGTAEAHNESNADRTECYDLASCRRFSPRPAIRQDRLDQCPVRPVRRCRLATRYWNQDLHEAARRHRRRQ